MIIEYFVNGVLIGLVFGMPIGAVGAMSIQRTINHGVVAGFISGAASSLADVLYACVGAFGLTVISDFLLTYQMPIHLIGAYLMILIAIRMITKKEMMLSTEKADVKDYLKMFLLLQWQLQIQQQSFPFYLHFLYSVLTVHLVSLMEYN